MDIKRVAGRKKEYLGLLLLADEQENMVDRYLERGEMFVLDGSRVLRRSSPARQLTAHEGVLPESPHIPKQQIAIRFRLAQWPPDGLALHGSRFRQLAGG